MFIHVVSAQFTEYQWRAIKAFVIEEEADEYAESIYENGHWRGQRILDSRVDEVNLED